MIAVSFSLCESSLMAGFEGISIEVFLSYSDVSLSDIINKSDKAFRVWVRLDWVLANKKAGEIIARWRVVS